MTHIASNTAQAGARSGGVSASMKINRAKLAAKLTEANAKLKDAGIAAWLANDAAPIFDAKEAVLVKLIEQVKGLLAEQAPTPGAPARAPADQEIGLSGIPATKPTYPTKGEREAFLRKHPVNVEMARAFLGIFGSDHTFQTFDDNRAREDQRKDWVRTLPEEERGRANNPLAKIKNGTLDNHLENLSYLNGAGAGTYFTVNQTDGKGRRRNNMVRGRAIYADFDGPDAVALFEAAAAKLPPSVVVASSPTKRHAYWLCDMTIEEAEQVQAAMPAATGCDPGAKDVTRVLRIPGFHHCKLDAVRTELLESHPERTYEPSEIISALGLDMDAVKVKPKAKVDRSTASRAEGSVVVDYDPLDYAINERDANLLHAALRHVGEDGKRVFDPASREVWVRVGMALSRSGEVGFNLFHEWSAEAGRGYEGEDDCRYHFDQFAADAKSRYPSIFVAAQAAGWAQGAVEADPGQDKLSTVSGSSFITWGNQVQMVRVAWFWRHRLATGMFHLLGGTPGTGKSTIAFTWAATISAGGVFPDGERAPKGKVLIWSGEDSYEATIKPRLVAAGADMANIGFLNQPRALKDGTKVDFNPADHLPTLMAEIEAMPKGEVAMLIIDPIVTVIGDKDNNSTSEVRSALAPLVSMLDKLGIIGLGIMHFTKGSETKDPKDRFNGSSGYIALARVGFAVVKDQNEDGRHLLTVAKSNIGPEGGGYNYHIEQTEVTDPVAGTIETSKVVWGDTLEGDARTLIREAEVVQRDRPANKLQQAKAFLRELLSSGPRLAHDIRAAAEDAEIGWRTVENAKREIGVASERSDPDNNRSPYHWLIPVTDFDEVADAASS